MEKTYTGKISKEGIGSVTNFAVAIVASLIFALLGPVDFLVFSLALAVLILVLFKPFYGLCFLAVSIPYAGVLQIAPKLTANKIFALWVVLSFILGILIKKEKIGIFSSNTLKFYLLFHIYLLSSFPFRTLTPESIEGLFSRTFLLGLVFLIATIPRDYREFKIFCIVSAAGSALMGIYIAIFGMGALVGEYGTRLAAGTNENVLSHALAIGLLLSFFAFRGSSRKLKCLILGLDVFSIYAILLTGSRGTWIALILSVALFPLFAPNIPLKTRFSYVFAGALTVSVIVLGLTNNLFGQWGQLVMDRFFEHDSVTEAAGGRVNYIWPYYISQFFEKPFLGGGLGSSDYVGMSAHNDWLFVLVETGAIGLTLFLLFHIFALRDILRNKDTILRLQALIWFVFLIVAGLTHNTVGLKSYALMVGALCFLAKMSDQRRVPR